ncbi:hypothetical protein HJFPF1_06131 [Paramyrothecium foliicola]|nr:hypothetical protein HJFPF1_06131 [Paramyrothecium foliicola]
MEQWTPPPNPGSMADLFPPGTDLCLIPARPTDRTNFDNKGLRDAAIAVAIPLVVTVSILTFGRLYTNTRKLSISDVFVLLAMLLNVVQGVLMIVYARYFRHIWDIPLCVLDGEYMLVSYIWQVVYVFNQVFAKTATLLLFNQLFTVSNPMRRAIQAGIVFAFAFYTTGLSLSSYYAAPHAGQTWDELMVKSINTTIFALKWGVAQGSVNVLFDIYIFVLPLPIIARLNLSLKKKMKIIALFLVGLLGVVASIISLAYRVKSIQGPNPDSTFNNVGFEMFLIILEFSLSEMSASLIICTAPAFASFMRVHVLGSKVFKSLRSTWASTESSKSPHGNSSADDPNRPRTHSEDPLRPKRAGLRNMTGYIEMSDTWLLNSGTGTVDIEAPSQSLSNNVEERGLRVVRTVDVKHTAASEPRS